MNVGYCRVSSSGQSLDIQIDQMKHCEKIFSEKKSGREMSQRQELSNCLDFVRSGDTLFITKLDRIARSMRSLMEITSILERKNVNLVVMNQNIDTATSAGRLMFSMLGMIAEFENDLRRERQSEGIVQAKCRGVTLGRKQVLTDSQIDEIRVKRQSGVLIKDLMREYRMSKASIYRFLS